ncbi:hypothetical protein T492DRAFT_950280 [Pavlovales sp. CCMP2436]|nr:hypothetical protein T492DRAFT_950280 [Pavlovales sp. CCMP2436]
MRPLPGRGPPVLSAGASAPVVGPMGPKPPPIRPVQSAGTSAPSLGGTMGPKPPPFRPAKSAGAFSSTSGSSKLPRASRSSSSSRLRGWLSASWSRSSGALSSVGSVGKRVVVHARISPKPGLSSVETRDTEASSSADRVFLPPEENLCCLALSSWFVPTVKNHYRGLPAFIIATCIQATFVGYLAVNSFQREGPCGTPALLQACAVYVFATTTVAEFSALRTLEFCWCTERVRVLGGTRVDERNHLRQEADQVLPIKATSRRARRLLCLLPITEAVVELALFIVGCFFLIQAQSTTDLIADTVALNFISQIDEVCLRSYFTPATRHRLQKYQFEHRWGVEQSDTTLKNISLLTARILKLQKYLPVVMAGGSIVIIALGQLIGATLLNETTCRAFASDYN